VRVRSRVDRIHRSLEREVLTRGQVAGLDPVEDPEPETDDVPQLGREPLGALDPLRGERHVGPGRGVLEEGEAERVGPVLVDELERVDHVAEALRHLLAVLVAHHPVVVDHVERHLVEEPQPDHQHPRHPEGVDVVAGLEDRRRVPALQLGRGVPRCLPPEGGEGPTAAS
jgi:hypothetical protein